MEYLVPVIVALITGGFSVLNSSIGGYNNPAAEWVIAIFMFLFGINFNLFYLVIIGKVKNALKSNELITYVIIVLLSISIVSINIYFSFLRILLRLTSLLMML